MLTLRPQPLTLDEGQKLGIETALQIAKARELSRGTQSGTKPSAVQLGSSELRSVVQDVFNLGEASFEFLVYNFFSAL